MTDPGEHGTSFWVIFASALIGLGSISHFAAGLTMVLNTNYVLANSDFSSASDVKTLGWIQLGIAVLMVGSAWGVLARKTWARAIGVIFGVLTVVHGISNLELNVFWGLATILVGAAIVYALTVKGDVVEVSTIDGLDVEGSRGLEPELPGERATRPDPDY